MSKYLPRFTRTAMLLGLVTLWGCEDCAGEQTEDPTQPGVIVLRAKPMETIYVRPAQQEPQQENREQPSWPGVRPKEG